ncbi:MAG TPA: PilZ domain-containing protein [Thermoanaerobaculia bacterium]|nr:PilZ domain-containing protein [Thermoanaerobaculia bacterium]
MQSRGDERREFQRLQLDPPLDATYGSNPVAILEIGVLGARIRHDAEPETRSELRFSGDGQPIAMRCEVVRTMGDQSGLRFLAAVDDSGDRLRAMLARIVTKALDDRHESSATKIKVRRTVDGDKTVRTTDAHFVSYRLEDGGWKRRHVFLPEQPAIGFTVARGVDAEEMRALCAVYEASDDEGRRLIRLFAELSVSSVLQIPPST